MRILLIGEYSSLHWTLAQGLTILGHELTVASDGDGFKNYPRDIDFALKGDSFIEKLSCLKSILKNKHMLKGFDIVQLINPCFTRIHPINLHLYHYLKRHNGKVFLGAFGDDYYYTKMCLENKCLRYSEFYVGDTPNPLSSNEDMKRAWLGSARGRANIEIAQSCDGIIACLYEYYVAYKNEYAHKLHYIPLPINTSEIAYIQQEVPDKVNFFIGINKARCEAKGLTILENILVELQTNYPTQACITRVESIPYAEYRQRIKQSNVVVDQLYGYSPAMNGLLAMGSGKILAGGGEPEIYDLLNEHKNCPIINITPNRAEAYKQLENIVISRESIPSKSKDSRLFVEKHHDYVKVAQQYLDIWNIST